MLDDAYYAARARHRRRMNWIHILQLIAVLALLVTHVGRAAGWF